METKGVPMMHDADKLACIAQLLDCHRNGKVSAHGVVVGLAIIEAIDAEGRCSLSREEIGKRTGIGRLPTISAKVTELRKCGFLEVGWACRINTYSLPMQSECPSPPPSKHNGKRTASTPRERKPWEENHGTASGW